MTVDIGQLGDAFGQIIQPGALVFLVGGTLLGLAFGLMPGSAGLTGLSILMVFTVGLEDNAAIMLVIGLLASTSTADTLPAVLFAIPGSSSSQATIMDGHPLAKKGEAERALGAAYLASGMGGLIGAVVLTMSIGVLKPYVLAFTSPELFMLAVLGVVISGTLLGPQPLKGAIAGGVGILLGMIGLDSRTGTARWTFDTFYLFDGLPIVIIAMGLFAIPEILDQMIKGRPITDRTVAMSNGGVLRGMRDTVRHWWLVVRTSMIGVGVGAVPGLGGPVIDWIAYAHAKQTEKGASETFGKGDIRGVIGVDGATNAKEGGGLIPTLAFGIPGSATYALVLAVLLSHGINVGTEIFTTRVDVFYTIIWSLVIANMIAVLVMLSLVKPMTRLSLMPIHKLAPFLIVVICFAAFQATSSFLDLVWLVVIAVAAWTMKRGGWPRPPLIIGFILSPLMERYLFISVQRHDWTWIGRPLVLVLAALGVLMLSRNGLKAAWKKVRGRVPDEGSRLDNR